MDHGTFYSVLTGYIEFGPDITQKQQGTKIILSSEDEVSSLPLKCLSQQQMTFLFFREKKGLILHVALQMIQALFSLKNKAKKNCRFYVLQFCLVL